MAAVLHHSRAKGTAKLVLLGIANHAGDGGAWPSVATLAHYANVTERNAQQAIAKLVQLGEVRVSVQGGGNAATADHRRPNRYDVLVSCPPWCDRTPTHRDTRRLAGPQPGLWKTGVSESTPGVGGDTRGVSESTPVGVSVTTPEPPYEPNLNPNVPSALSTDRAREHHLAPCDVCALAYAECVARAATSGHSYRPRKGQAARVLHTARAHFGGDDG